MDMSERDENMVLFALFAAAFAFLGAVPVALPSAALFAAFTRWDYNDMPPVLFGFGLFATLYVLSVVVVIRKIGL